MYRIFEGVLIDSALYTLAIECQYDRCSSACCRGEGIGSPLQPFDAERLSTAPNISSDSEEYIEMNDGARLRCRDDGDCELFDSKKLCCTVNQYKPDFCTLYPIVLDMKGGMHRIGLESFSGCYFSTTDVLYVLTIEDILRRRIGDNWTDRFIAHLREECPEMNWKRYEAEYMLRKE